MAKIFVIIAVLVTFLRILKLLGIEKLMGILLKPTLSLLGISRDAVIVLLKVYAGIIGKLFAYGLALFRGALEVL